jgi:hypothetical protein
MFGLSSAQSGDLILRGIFRMGNAPLLSRTEQIVILSFKPSPPGSRLTSKKQGALLNPEETPVFYDSATDSLTVESWIFLVELKRPY